MKILGFDIEISNVFDLGPGEDIDKYAPFDVAVAATEVHGDGYARPWDKPGLGIEVDWDWVEAHTVNVEE